MMKLLCFIIIFILPPISNGEFLCPFQYVNETKAVEIELKFRFYNFFYFDDIDDKLSCNAFVIATWHDPCGWKLAQKLMPNRTKHVTGGISLDRSYFWLPLILQHIDDNPKAFDTVNTPLIVNSNGYVEFWGRKIWIATCEGQLAKFPFDSHRCSFLFTTWETIDFVKISRLTLDFSSDNLQLNTLELFSAQFLKPRNFSLPYDCLGKQCISDWAEFPLILTRRWFPYYFHGLFIPLALLSLIQILTLLLNFNEIDRITLSATIFLAYAVFSSQIASFFPVTSQHVYMATAGTSMLILSILSTIFYISIYTWQNTFKIRYKTNKIGTIFFLLSYCTVCLVTCLYMIL